MAYDFSLDRKGVISLAAGSVALLLLVFFAGVLTGIGWQSDRDVMWANRQQAPAAHAIIPAKVAVPAKKETASPEPAAAPQAAASARPAAASPAPAEAKAGASPPPAAPSPASPVPATSAAAPAAAPATASTPMTANSSGVELAVQVGAFLDKANAEKLAERLKEAGYASQIVLGGHAPRQWNIVRVGPYHDWDEASEIAALLSRDQATPAVIRLTK